MKKMTFGVATLAVFALALGAQGASLYWDGGTSDIGGEGDGASAGGAGTWDATIKNWDEGASAHVAWTDSNDAVFGGTAGTVTLGATITAGTLTLNTADYIFDLGSNNLTLSGLAGSVASTFKGASGTLTISGSSSYSGGITLGTGTANQGVVSLGHSSALGTGGLTVAGAQIRASTTGLTFANNITFATGGLRVGGSNDFTMSGTLTQNADSALQNYGSSTVTLSGDWTRSTYTTTFEAGNFTVSGKMDGSGAITVGNTDVGTVIFSGANTFTGSTTVSKGTLKLGNATALGTTAAGTSVTSGAVLDLNGQAISNTEALTLNGTGISSGGALINSGTTAASFAGGISLNSASSIGGSGNSTLSGIITGAYTLTKVGSGTVTLSGNNTNSGNVDISGGTLKVSGSSAHLYNGGYISSSVLTINTNGTLELDSFAYQGAGGLGQLRNQGNARVLSGGTINIVGNTHTSGNNFNVANGSSGTFTMATAGKTLTLDGNGNSNIAIGGQLTIGGAGNITVNEIIENNTSEGSILKTGAGTLTLSGANTYSGNTTINGGTLKIGTGGVIYSGNYRNSVVKVNSGGVLDLQNWGYDQSNNTTSLGGLTANATGVVVSNGTVRVSNTSATSYGRGVTLNGTATLEANGSALWTVDTVTDSQNWVYNNNSLVLTGDGIGGGRFDKVFSGNGSLTKSGTGTWTLGGANSYNGGTAINGGHLIFASGAVPTSGTITINNGGSLVASGAQTTVTGWLNSGKIATSSAGNIAITGNSSENINFSTGAFNSLGLASTGTATYSGTITPGSSGYIFGGSASMLTVSSNLTTATALTKKDAGTLILSGANTYNGGTSIQSGTLQIGGANGTVASQALTLGSGSNSGILVLGDGSNAKSLTFSSLNTSGTGTGNAIVAGGSASSSSLTINTTTTDAFAGVIGGAGSNQNLISLTKSGNGTLTLSGANTYNGGTSIQNGTLQIGGTSGTVASQALIIGSGSNSGVLILGDASNAKSLTFSSLNTSGTGTSNAIVAGGSASSSSLTINTTSTDTFAGVIGGTGSNQNLISLTKSGNGALTISGNNTYTGGTTLSAGTLNINSTTALGTGSITISGGTIDNTSGGSITLSNSNTQNWNGDFTFTGSNALNMGTGAVTLSATRQVTVSASTLTVGGAMSGNYAFTKAGNGTLAFTGANTTAEVINVNAGTMSVAGNWTNGNNNITVASGATLTVTSSGSLYKGAYANAAVLTVSGTLNVTSFVYNINGSDGGLGALRDYGSARVLDGGTINVTGNDQSTGNDFYVKNGSTGTFNMTTSGKTLALSGNGNSNIAIGGALTFGGAGNITVGEVIEDNTGAGSIIKDGAGTLKFTTRGTYTGATTLNGGVLELATPNSGRALTTSGITVNSGATLNVNGTNILYDSGSPNVYIPITVNGGTVALISTASGSHNHFGTLTLNGGTLWGKSTSPYSSQYAALDADITVGGSATSTIKGDSASFHFGLAGTRTFTVASTGDPSGVDLLVSATLGDTGSLIKEGAGIMKLSGNNTYTGNTTINSGTLQVTGASAYLYNGGWSNSPVITVKTGGTLKLDSFAYGAAGGTGQLADYRQRRVLDGGTFEVTGGTHSSGNDFTVNVTTGGTFRYNPAVTTDTLTLSGNGNTDIQVDGPLTFDTIGNITVSEAIAGTGSLSKTGAGALTLSGANTYSGGTTLSVGQLNINSATALGATASTFTISGSTIIDNTSGGAITLSNNNAQNWNGNFTFTGSNALNLGTGAVAMNASRQVTVTASTLTVGGTISGSGYSLTKAGGGTLVLNGSNSYTGGTFVNAGTLQVGNATATNKKVTLNGGKLTITNGVTYNIDNGLTFASNTDATVSAASGTAKLSVWDVNGTDITVNTGITASIDSTVSASISGAYGLVINTAGTGALTMAGKITDNTTIGMTGGYFGVSSVNGDKFSTYKLGTGTLTLTGASDYTVDSGTKTAAMAVTQGTLKLSGGDNRLPIASAVYLGNTSNNSATLALDGISQTLAGLQSIGTGATAVVGSSATLSTLTVNNTNNYTFSGELGGAGTNENNLALAKSGNGTLTLSGTNTYTGGTELTGGTLSVGALSGIGTGYLAVKTGATFKYTGTGSDSTTRNLWMDNGAATIEITSASGSLTWDDAGDKAKTGNFTKTGAGTLVMADPLTGTGQTVTVSGGTLTLTGANTYTGATLVSVGMLEVMANNALGTNAAGTTVASGAALKLNAVSYDTAEALEINGSGISGGGALVNIGTSTYAGQVTAATSATINAGTGSLTFTGGLVKNGTTLTFKGGGTVTVNTVGISGSSANSDLVVDGTTLTISVASTYNGPTSIINGGTLNANVINALPTENGRSAVTLDASSSLVLGADQAAASLTGDSSSTVNLGANKLTVGTTSGSTTFAGVISGTLGSLEKDGASTLVLSGDSIYTGATSVVAGVLEITSDGSLGTTAVTVSDGATLTNNGTITGNVNSDGTVKGNGTFGGGLILASGATLAPGTTALSAGTMTISSGTLTLGSESTFVAEINGAGAGSYDQVVFTGGGLVINGATLNVVLGYIPTPYTDSFTLFSNYTSLGGTPGTFNELSSGDTFKVTSSADSKEYWMQITYNAGEGGNDIVLSVIPEPGTAGIVATFLAAALLRMRRPKK